MVFRSGLLRKYCGRFVETAYLSISHGKPRGNLRANCSGKSTIGIQPLWSHDSSWKRTPTRRKKEMVIQTEIKKPRKMFLGANRTDAAQSCRAERWLRNIPDPYNRTKITPISRLGGEMVNSVLRG